MSMMIIIPRLKKIKKVRITKDLCSGSYASRPKNSSQKSFSLSNQQAVFFYHFLSTMFYFTISQKITQLIGEVEIDMIEVIVLQFTRLQYCYAVFKELHHRKYCENCFFLVLQIFILNTKVISSNTKESYRDYLRLEILDKNLKTQ